MLVGANACPRGVLVGANACPRGVLVGANACPRGVLVGANACPRGVPRAAVLGGFCGAEPSSVLQRLRSRCA